MTDKSKSVETDSEASVNLKGDLPARISREKIQSRYGDLLDSLPIIIYIVEPHPPYSPIYVSKGIEMLGYTQEDWHKIPDLWVTIIHEDDREWVLDETRQAIREHRETDFKYRVYSRNGAVYWLHDKGHFRRDENGEFLTWEGFLLDITETKNLEERETKSFAEIDAVLAQKSSKTILLVEDEEIIREMVRQILQTGNYRILTAANGPEALEICRKENIVFDLLITDFNMPQMNGRELAANIKKMGCAKKVLYISGFSDDKEFMRDIADSEKYFIAKPFSPEFLTTRVAEILDED